MSDDGAWFTFWSAIANIFLIVFLIVFMYGNLTYDLNVTKGNTFKLGEAVYQCKQIQKLEYGSEK